jgi:ABC-type branched-subunit amino acid transport system ATPase component
LTILLVDHDMDLILNLCHPIYVLDFGAVIASGSSDDIRADARVTDAYLGGPHRSAAPAATPLEA